MNSFCLPEFWELLNRLPEDVREKAYRNFRLWLNDPHHSSLDFKKFKGQDIWQVRAAHGYRAFCDREGDEYTWFWIGTKAEAKKLI